MTDHPSKTGAAVSPRPLASAVALPQLGCGGAGNSLRFRACASCAESVGMLNVVANIFLTILKAYLGVVGGSAALVADAIHSLADVISAIMLVVGLQVAGRQADSSYPYGYGKVEFLVAVVIYTSLLLAAFLIFGDAIYCILQKECVNPSVVTLFGAIISIAVNEVMFRQSVCVGTQLKSPSMVANAWEKRSDAISSVAVLLGITGAKLGYHCLDPAAAIVVAVYIFKGSVDNITEAFRGLLDRSLSTEIVAGIREAASKVQGVSSISALRTREIGQMAWIDIEVQVDGDLSVEEVLEIKQAVEKAVKCACERQAMVAVYVKPV